MIGAVDGGAAARQVAATFGVSIACIYKALTRRRLTGDSTPSPNRGHPARRLKPDQEAALVAHCAAAGPMDTRLSYLRLPFEVHGAEIAQCFGGPTIITTKPEHADGWLYLVDRKKDMIVASGFKVWPREVEDVLYAHPAIRLAAVIGVPDAYRGETVMAAVSLHPEAGADAAALIAFCRERLAAYKAPRIVHILDELPVTATGKIKRRDLRVQTQSAA